MKFLLYIIYSNSLIYIASIKGVLRLTTNGTKYFEVLTSNKRDTILQRLLLNISNLVPADLNRLSLEPCCQYYEHKANPGSQRQMLVGVNIAQIKDLNALTTFQIKNDLDSMIRGGLFKQNDGLELIDSTYGFVQRGNY